MPFHFKSYYFVEQCEIPLKTTQAKVWSGDVEKIERNYDKNDMFPLPFYRTATKSKCRLYVYDDTGPKNNA